MQVFTLFEGSYSVAADKKFIPFDPQTDQAKDRPGSLFIHVQPFLIKLGSHLLLLDTGLGYSNDEGRMILHENIKKAGFEPQDVDYVLMSHLHFDHSGGMVHRTPTGMDLSFPNATYVINRGEWESAFSKTSSSYRTDIFDFVQRNAQIQFVEDSGDLTSEISYILTGGHTPFHQAWFFDDGQDKVFFGGDVLPEPEELVKKFIAKYDYDGRRSMELREEFGKSAAENNWLCLFYHGKSKTTAFVEQNEEGHFKVV
ncbi:MBL fold metallo-hydrolase [Pedobacter antarcticus]|uniref:MBL fold metallo-hydrolase n=1 Tax=Pedobacter antarcticus TaxID=34086 RepID=UPI000880BA92|nr:MBL fold metallo-hydrolase [Pedobacter antarcticus]SDM55138.1 Glyoxylase, beta-lactamase superfamily II [Pedobacter antarcticus]